MSALPIPQIQIRQTPALLGIDADLGTQSIEQPRPTFEMEQPRAQMEIHNPLGHFEIDQSAAWDGLGLGGNMKVMNRIYSTAPDIALQGLARIVEEGNRMADLTNPNNPFAELAADWRVSFPEFDIYGEAAYNNVKTDYVRGNFTLNAEAGHVKLHTEVNRPIYEYTRGKLDLYMQQYNKVEIIPPAIDTEV